MIPAALAGALAVIAAAPLHVALDPSQGRIDLGGETLARFGVPALDGRAPDRAACAAQDDGWWRVEFAWDLAAPVQQDRLAAPFDLEMAPDFWWAPHLAPAEGDCIGQHVFRSPALIAAQGPRTLCVVPDLDRAGRVPSQPWYLDADAPARRWQIGLSNHAVRDHVRYTLEPGMTLGPGPVVLAFYVYAFDDAGAPRNPFGPVAAMLWRRFAGPAPAPAAPLDAYVDRVYRWAFDGWRDAVWQEFKIGRKRAGAPAFIVNVTESPNYPGEPNLREFLSIWNQAWFSSLRSASGLWRYAQRTHDRGLRRRAERTKALALAAPRKQGFFPSVYRTEMETVTPDGAQLNRSKGWETGYWCNSNRCPTDYGITDAWYHVLDMSWTALLMLRWHAELEPDPALLEFARTYGDALLPLQDADGFFPAWLHPGTLAPSPVLAQSPESSMSVTFLLALAEATGDARYREAALRALDAVLRETVPAGRWEDFETYWSCNRWGSDTQLGRKVERNGMYKQCNFSMYWTAEALLEAHRATGRAGYLAWGRRVLDELSMTQQVWQPPFIHVPARGGFGVMNFDGEWNDARQSLFAGLFMRYYAATGEPALFERGIAALHAAFYMMYCPENPQVKALWERVWPFFGPEDYGFTMENYGHGGAVSPEGDGMGEFTIYDWGNGAAAEARNRIRDHFGDVYVDRARGRAFGIDGIDARLDGNTLALAPNTPGHGPRSIRIVFDGGASRDLELDGPATLALD